MQGTEKRGVGLPILGFFPRDIGKLVQKYKLECGPGKIFDALYSGYFFLKKKTNNRLHFLNQT